MLSALILAAIAPQTVALPPRTTLACRQTRPEFAAARNGQAGVRRLTELPNANAYLAVMRLDTHGCERPVIVRYDIGGAPRRQR